MSKSSHILPTNNLAMEMAHCIGAVKISLGAFDLVSENDVDLCRAYIAHLVECYLDEKMLWVAHQRRKNKHITNEMVVIPEDEEHQRYIDKVEEYNEAINPYEEEELLQPLLVWVERYPEALPRLHDIIDGIDEDVANLIDHVISETTWNVWLILKYGKDLMLTEEEDFRITDWMRRQVDGEWCDEHSNSGN